MISIRSSDSCVGDNTLPGSTKEWTFLDELRGYRLLREGAAVCCSLYWLRLNACCLLSAYVSFWLEVQ